MRKTRRLAAGAACLVVLTAGVSACSSQPAVCDDLDALQASVNNLKHAQVGENALSTLSTEAKNIRSDLTQLRNDAANQYAPEIDALSSEVTNLQTSIDNASSTPSATSFSAVADGVRAVGSAVGAVADAAGSTCK